MSSLLEMVVPEKAGKKSCQVVLNLKGKGKVCVCQVGLVPLMSGLPDVSAGRQ